MWIHDNDIALLTTYDNLNLNLRFYSARGEDSPSNRVGIGICIRDEFGVFVLAKLKRNW
jgi:hypothetical protein